MPATATAVAAPMPRLPPVTTTTPGLDSTARSSSFTGTSFKPTAQATTSACADRDRAPMDTHAPTHGMTVAAMRKWLGGAPVDCRIRRRSAVASW